MLDDFSLAVAEMVADLFSHTVAYQYDSQEFCEKFCNSDTAYHLGSVYAGVQFGGVNYLESELYDEISIQAVEPSRVSNADVMYWIGYTYCYWNRLNQEQYSEIYKQAPFHVMAVSYLAYHCLSVEEAIFRLKEAYNLNNSSK